jgi:hypothetical protein
LSAALLVGCGAPTPTPAPTVAASPRPTVEGPTDTPTEAAPPTSTTPQPALVGSWVGIHNCERILDILHGAGMDDQILPTIVGNGLLPGITDPADVADPGNACADAIELEHSHFFTPDGLFGSRDQNNQQVDDGEWSIVDADTFAINEHELFDYEIVGDELRMSAVTVGTCPPDPAEWCVATWRLMVSMPGMAWTRAP